MLMIDDTQITFVIQGAVCFHGGINVTAKCIRSIKRYHPCSKVVLSTWNASEPEVPSCNLVVKSADPGEIPTSNSYLRNYNRMIVSTLNGLRHVQTRYAVKIRSDFWIDHRINIGSYLHAISCSEPKYSKDLVLMCMSSRHYRLFPFFISDWFHFGEIDAMLAIWDTPLLSPQEIDGPPAAKGVVNFPFVFCDVYDSMDYHLHSEQRLALKWLQKLGHIKNTNNTSELFTFKSLLSGYLVLGKYLAVESRYKVGLRSYKHDTRFDRRDLFCWKTSTSMQLSQSSRLFVLAILLLLLYLRMFAYLLFRPKAS